MFVLEILLNIPNLHLTMFFITVRCLPLIINVVNLKLCDQKTEQKLLVYVKITSSYKLYLSIGCKKIKSNLVIQRRIQGSGRVRGQVVNFCLGGWQ